MMRFSILGAFLLVLCASATANIIPTSTTITGTGPLVWSYDLQLSIDQNFDSGIAPTSSPVPHGNLTNAGPQVGTVADNVDNTQGPEAVPEPGKRNYSAAARPGLERHSSMTSPRCAISPVISAVNRSNPGFFR